MGYYIHSTPKMRYKAAFSPSYLACPETHTWVPIEKCARLLDKFKYTRLAAYSDKRSLSSVSEDETDTYLPLSVQSFNKLKCKDFRIEGGALLIPLEDAESILSPKELELAREWTTLVSDYGTMCINCIN